MEDELFHRSNLYLDVALFFRKIVLGGICLCVSVLFITETSATKEWDITNTGQPFHDVEFSLTEGSWMSVDVSPSGRTLVFDLLGDLYLLPAHGGIARLLHGGADIARTPSFNPDGSKILFLSDLSGSDNVWTINLDGSDLKQLTMETVDMLAGPEWHPNDNYIAVVKQYANFMQTQSSEVWLYHLLGGDGRVLVKAPANGRDVHEIEFSSDGRFVYYTERVMSPHIYVDANSTNFAIKRKELETGKVETIIQGFGGAITPQVSNDGKHLAFIRRVKDKTVLFSYNILTREQRPVYDNLDRDAQGDFGYVITQGAYYPQFDWFPDNQHVVVWGKGKFFKINMVSGKVVEIPFTAQSQHRMTEVKRIASELAPDEFTARAIRQIALNPSGQDITASVIGYLWQKKIPNGKASRLTKSLNFEFEPTYSSDGKQIAYVAWNDEKGSALKVMSVSGKETKTITTSLGVIREPSFSPDGKYLSYRIEDSNKIMGGYKARGGLYLVNTKGGKPSRIGDASMTKPMFSPDNERVYFSKKETSESLGAYAQYKSIVTTLKSINLDGFDEKKHVVSIGADRLDLRLSPDLKWLAFKEQQQYYVMPFLETGDPITVKANGGAVPVVKLTKLGGNGITWSANSQYISWTVGQKIYRVSVDQLLKAQPDLPSELDTFNIQIKGDRPEGSIALTNGQLITMKGEEIIAEGTLIVEGNIITAIGRTEDVSIPEGVRIIDLKGKTIMPGLVDMHGHIDCCYYGGLMPQQQPAHYAAAAFGVTTNFDPYTSELASYTATEMQKSGVQVGPRFISSGKVIYGRSNKGDVTYHPINSYEDALNIMQRKKILGGSFIKSYKQPTRTRRQQLVKAGREIGIMVDVEGESHFYNNVSMILDGHMTLEHNLPLANYYDDIVQLMAHSEIANTPTLVVTFGEIMGENYMYQNTRSWEDPKVKTFVQEVNSSYSPLMTPVSAPLHVRGMQTLLATDEIWEIGVKAVSRSTKKLDDAGVIINVGSHGQIPGLAMHWEMQLMSLGGMSNFNILRSATLNGARTLGLDKQIGSLEVGKLADIIVLDKDPLKDIKNTNSVKYTMINGRLYDSSTMNEIGNYDRPRREFYWELQDYNGIDWNESWSGK